MAKIGDSLWPIEPHTLAKHTILKGHLDAWFPIMATTWHKLVYIDGFAGPGRYSGGEDGSPLIALKAVINRRQQLAAQFTFLFIEADKDRKENLDQEVAALLIPSNCEVIVHQDGSTLR